LVCSRVLRRFPHLVLGHHWLRCFRLVLPLLQFHLLLGFLRHFLRQQSLLVHLRKHLPVLVEHLLLFHLQQRLSLLLVPSLLRSVQRTPRRRRAIRLSRSAFCWLLCCYPVNYNSRMISSLKIFGFYRLIEGSFKLVYLFFYIGLISSS